MPKNKVIMPKQKISKGTVKRLLSYLKEYKGRFTLVCICIIITASTGVAGSLFLQTLIDDYITPLLSVQNPVFTSLLKAICIMGLIYFVGIISTFIYTRIMVSIAQGILKKIRDEMFEKMEKLPIKYFDTNTHGDIMSHYTSDTDTLMDMIGQSIPQMLSSVITIIAVFCAMLSINIYLTGLVVLVIFIMFGVTKRVGGKAGKYFAKQQKSIGTVNGYIEEMINGQKVVKVFCYEERAKQNFDKLNDELCKNSANANKFANILMPIMVNLGYIQYVLIAITGGIFVVNGVGGLKIGAIASFLQLSRNFSMPITQVSQQINSIVMALAGAERIFKLMDEEPEDDEGNVTLVNVDDKLKEVKQYTGRWAWKVPNGEKFEYVELNGRVDFLDVNFGYEENKTILHNINLYAKPGQKIAFVGATGAGKTTVTNLLNRFYDITEGQILYDGIDIKRIKKDDLRRSLGMVLQDTNLFTGTIKENIRYGNLEATDEEVINAAKIANADEFISMLPDGYDTVIGGNGESLSQGQRQLLSIARAAIANPPVMILDEATSSIDTRTEKIVQEGMDRLMDGRTVFVIAHRLSTVQNSKAIMVLENGEIIERGDHEDLISQKGEYYQLYTGAFELE